MSGVYVGKAIYVFDEHGNGRYSIEWPWPATETNRLGAMGERFSIENKALPDTYWMDDDGVCHVRPTVQIATDRTRIIADGEDGAVVSGLPNEGCVVLINGERHPVEDDDLLVSTEAADDYIIQLTGAHKSNELVVTAVDLVAHRDAKKAEINATRASAMATSPTSFGVFDSNAEAKQNISGIVTGITAVGAANHPDIPFRMADNSLHTFTPAEFVQASLEVSAHISNVYARSWALKEHIDTLDDLDAIDAVTWETQLD